MVKKRGFVLNGGTCAFEIGFNEVGKAASSCFASRYAGVKKKSRKKKREKCVVCLAGG
jgi:hypothetical protein